MKICPKCHINVGNESELCPICQNGLEGENDGGFYWPPAQKLKKQSIVYKIQLQAVLSAVVISLGLDFLLNLHGQLHWSVIIAIWGILGEYTAHRIMKRIIILPQIISRIIISVIISTLVTSAYVGFWDLAVSYIIPGIVIGALICNFVLSLIDRKENAMVYLLCSILGGIIPFAVTFIIRRQPPMLWSICLMLSVIFVIGIAVFKGSKMVEEIRRRVNI